MQTSPTPTAVEAVGWAGLVDAVPALLRLIDDPNDDIRDLAVAALGTLGAAEATEELVERLGSGSERYRAKVSLALGQIARAGQGGAAAVRAVRGLVAALAVANQRSSARR